MILHTSLAASKVIIHDGKAVTTTDDVAVYFGKQPHHVIQKVESLECLEDLIIHNFSRMIKNVQFAKGATREVVYYYKMTKDGFVFLVMGFTGKKAAAFKEAYIAEFNCMEAEFYSIPKYKPQAAELFNNNDIDRLNRLAWGMSNGFQFDRAWSNAIWHALRRVTGIPFP